VLLFVLLLSSQILCSNLTKGKQCTTNEYEEMAKEAAIKAFQKISTKVGTELVKAVIGSEFAPIVNILTSFLGFIGDLVDRDKCKLLCCPPEGLPSTWACKYQDKAHCNGHYSDYPGHGDHACWWNNQTGRCEVGMVCRDKTFSFFELFGSKCPPCQDCPQSEPQWSKEALKELELPARFFVNPPDEYNWCAPRGSPGDCQVNRNQSLCEMSYADHSGDKNCKWFSGKCVPGPKCDDNKQRVNEAKRLGLRYYNGAWRRNGIPVSYYSDYNHNNNHPGITDVNAQSLVKEYAKGFSAPFKGCLASCKVDLKNCVKNCVQSIKN